MSEPDTLSIHRSFIVRLYPGLDIDAGELSGWVEHVVSGEAGEFLSAKDLLRFIGRVLSREGNGPTVTGGIAEGDADENRHHVRRPGRDRRSRA